MCWQGTGEGGGRDSVCDLGGSRRESHAKMHRIMISVRSDDPCLALPVLHASPQRRIIGHTAQGQMLCIACSAAPAAALGTNYNVGGSTCSSSTINRT